MYVYEHSACMCVCLLPTEARKGCWDPLELELQMVVSYCVGAENQNCVLRKNSQCFSLLSYFSDPWTSL